MFVSQGAVKMLKKERKSEFFDSFIKPLSEEAIKLGLDKKDIIEMIEREIKNEEDN